MKKPLFLAMGALLLGLALAQADGAKVYTQYCAACHQAKGQGMPGAFPPLAGHVPEILAKKEGRGYLIQLVLYGLQGEILVKGAKYNGTMPSWAQLKDEEIAAVLNYVAAAWGNKPPAGFKPYTPAEVKAARAKPLTAQGVYALRKRLGF